MVLSLLGLSAAQAEVAFSGLNLAENDLLLFRAEAEAPSIGSYNTLFLADLKRTTVEQLTFFPERVMLLGERGILQIQNRFGVFRSDPELKRMLPIDTFPSFVHQNRVESGKLAPLQASPNGRFLLSLRQTSPVLADLLMLDLEGGSETLVAQGVELSFKVPPSLWSPDSGFFIYAKAGKLFYYSISQLKEKRVIAEEYREIGEGQIANVQWGKDSLLYYLAKSLVYELDSRELFTRALYTGYLRIGRIAGKIPFEFDPNFDRFWISPDGLKILLDKGGRNLFLYLLAAEDFPATDETQSLPYLFLPRSARVEQVLWSRSGTLTVLTEGIRKGEPHSALYRLTFPGGKPGPAFQALELNGCRGIALSRNEELAALIGVDRVLVYRYETWILEKERRHPSPLHVLWSSEEELLIAGANRTELWNLRTAEARTVALSQYERAGFSEDMETILVQSEGQSYSTAPGAGYWAPAASFAVKAESMVSSSYRVYLEPWNQRGFQNRVMVRSVKEFGTRPLQSPAVAAGYEPFPAEEQPVDFVNFSHGSRIRRREVALVFNAVDTIEGLPGILATLKEYKLRATFFVNGEVIRRHPDAVREIAESGHEVGNLFYAYFDMTDARFRLDKEFIKRGLARNEDLYYQATGKELALLWHAPYYFLNSILLEASREMNYTYVGRDVDPLDWVVEEMSYTTPGIYLPAIRLVEKVLQQKKPGSIIPILIGSPEGRRGDYLFQKLDLLINGLIAQGYALVPATTLMEHAK